MLFFFAYFSLVKKNKVNKTNILSYYQIKKSSKVAKNRSRIKRQEYQNLRMNKSSSLKDLHNNENEDNTNTKINLLT